MSVASRTNLVHPARMKEEALVQFKLMLPAGLKARVEASAAANRRTLSQEIVVTLEEKFPAPVSEGEAAVVALLQIMEKYRDSEAMAEVRQNIMDAIRENSGILSSDQVSDLALQAVKTLQKHAGIKD